MDGERMDGYRTRRGFLAAAGSALFAGCSGIGETPNEPTPTPVTSTKTSTDTERSTSEEEWEIEPLNHDKLIGAHYYPWYTEGYWDSFQSVGTPVLGEYQTQDRDVVNQHIKWAREHGINWFNISWKPNTSREENMENSFLEAELSNQINFSILYESIGSATLFGNPSEEFSVTEEGNRYWIDFDQRENRETLKRHFQRLEGSYFDRPNYLHIDGRPVMYIYKPMNVKGAVKDAYAQAKDAVDTEPYIIGDFLGGNQANISHHWGFDAITEYGLYNQEVAESGDYDEFLDYAEKVMTERALTAEHIGIDYIPDIMPGFDDTALSNRDHLPIHRDAEGFREMCDIALDRADSEIEALLITSFNEWPEYTAVEPGESFDQKYLEIIEEELAKGSRDELESFDPNRYDVLQLDFNQTIQPEGSNRNLAVVGKEITLSRDDESMIAKYDIGVPEKEPYLVEGAYSPENTGWGRFRWFGGPTEGASIYFEPHQDTADSVEWIGLPIRDNKIEADVYFNGQQTDHVEFGKRSEPRPYSFSLSD